MGRRAIGVATHTLLLAVFVLVVAVLVSGCGSDATVDDAAASDDATPQRGGSIVVALAKEPPIINFWLAPGAMTVAQQLTDGLADPLVVLDSKGVWQPSLATTVPSLDNGGVVKDAAPAEGMTVSFDIQPAAAWSDGQPLTCADVRFTWKTVMTGKFQIATRLGWEHIDQIDCPQPRSVRIHFDRLYAPFLSRILAMPPLPEHELKGKDFNTAWNDRFTVSSGPYIFDNWQRGVRLVLKRNPNYWRTKAGGQIAAEAHGGAYLDRVVFRFVKDANTLKMQLRMQEADMAFIPADTNLEKELKSTPDVKYAILPGAVNELLMMRTVRWPLSDVRVRQAVAYAIDREMITRVILSGVVKPAVNPMVTTQAPAYTDTPFDRYTKADPDKTKALLEQAGWTRSGDELWTKNGKPLVLKWVAGAGSMPFRAKIAQLVQEQLRRQGIGIEITLVPTEVLYSTVAPHGQYHLGEWSELTGAEPLPALIYSCGEIPRKPSWAGKNRAAWCNKEADQLMQQADSEVDVAKRAKLVAAANEIIAEELPAIPLFQSPDVVAWRTRLHGLDLNPTANHTWNMDDWWVSG